MTASIRPELARRVVWEAEALHTKYPDRFRLRLDPQGRPAWHGCVPVEGRDAPLILTYPEAYPARPPLLETTADLPANCPHLLGRSGERATLCWLAPQARLPHRRWQPQRHTAATALRAGQRWFLAFLVWRALGSWPVADAWDIEDL
jgi:hypothetical protein